MNVEKRRSFSHVLMPFNQNGLKLKFFVCFNVVLHLTLCSFSSLLTQILVCRSKETLLFEWIEDKFNLSNWLMSNIRAHGEYEWIEAGSFKWNDDTEIPLAEVITKRGLGFSFNMQEADKLFKLSKYI